MGQIGLPLTRKVLLSSIGDVIVRFIELYENSAQL